MQVSVRVLALALAATLATAAVAAPPVKPWAEPSCNTVTGLASVTFTRDEGATLAPTAMMLSGTTYTFGLVATDAPNTMYAAKDRTIYRSTNAGCRWSRVDTFPGSSDGFPLSLSAAPGGIAYAWADNRGDLARVDGRSVVVLKSPGSSIVGLVAAASGTVRLGDGDGQLWESRDLGASWTPVGIPAIPAGSQIVYRAAIDPGNLDHALFGTTTQGFFVTTDGGQSWTKSSGLAADGIGPVNGFQAVVSPADGGVVYAMALDIHELDSGAPSQGRHIYRSVDGGFTFVPVVDQGPGVTLVNGPVMAAHPTDADVVYFVFGSSFGGFGTDLYRYDAAVNQVTKTHNDYHDVPSIAFNPANPSVVYLGLANEQIGF